MSLCPYVLLFPALAATELPPPRRQSISLLTHQQADKANFYVIQHTFSKYPPQNLAYTQVNPTFAPLDTNFPRPPAHRQTSTFARHRAQAVMSTARERKNARFFCTPQRAGIQRVTPVSREIPEDFSKIFSPKIWCVCQKSVPLHSQIRNEAYNTSQI